MFQQEGEQEKTPTEHYVQGMTKIRYGHVKSELII